MNNKVAILIFANNGAQEFKKIPEATLLFNTLNNEIKNKVQATNCDYFIFNENNQIGNTFGEKLSHAVQCVFTQGYQHVITVGNDTPQLTTSTLKVAIKNCAKDLLTFGPSNDGGFYLMTFNQQSFDAQKTKNLRWQTSALAKEVLQQLPKCQYVLLQQLNDIDSVNDVIYLFNHQHKNISSTLKLMFAKIVTKTGYLPVFSTTTYWGVFTKNTHNKGSPLKAYLH